jgi:hypothetical protein
MRCLATRATLDGCLSLAVRLLFIGGRSCSSCLLELALHLVYWSELLVWKQLVADPPHILVYTCGRSTGSVEAEPARLCKGRLLTALSKAKVPSLPLYIHCKLLTPLA